MEDKTHPFIKYLESLREREDRGALAALRRGMGHPPGTVPAMYPYVVRWLPKERWKEAAYYRIAALFAYHSMEGGRGNLGDHFAKARDPQGDDTAIERRFTALLAAHPDDFDVYLRQAVSFLRSKNKPINWNQLFYDVQRWGNPDSREYVQKNWARAFWGRPQQEKEATETDQ